MIEVRRYTAADVAQWDDLVRRARNATFLHLRGYMDYHADRFADHSLMAFKGSRLLAVMPGCERSDGVYSSHAGLTFGGWLTTSRTTVEDMLAIVAEANALLRAERFSRVVYKPVPHIYHTIPAEEDLYALFRLTDLRLDGRQVAAVVGRDARPRMFDIRRSGIRKAISAGLTVRESDDFASYWGILTATLAERHDATPVHSLDEIMLLRNRFPENIRLFMTYDGEEPLAGVVIYLTPMVAHCQYIAASPRGRDVCALDLLFNHLLTDTFAAVPWFDFGTSCLDGGRVLNEHLVYQKEGFGGRAVCYDAYTYTL